MTKFKWGNIKTASYLDAQSTDDVSIFNQLFNSLVSGLIKAGRLDDARKVIKKYDEVMPTNIYGIRNMMSVPTMAQNLYILGQTEKANALIKTSAAYIQKEVNYLSDISKSKNQLIGGYIADLVVANTIILELKSVQALHPFMQAQIINYLKLSKMPVGYLMNFNASSLEYRRYVNQLV